MILSHIVAVSENEVIGKDNALLWKISEDLKYFKKRTLGKILIMGRKTFESIGSKALPQRYSIVVSKTLQSNNFSTNSSSNSIAVVPSLKEAYALAEKLTLGKEWPEEVMIIGGGQIYKETLPDVDFFYITRVPGVYDGDSFYSLNLPSTFGLAFSQFSDENPGLRWEIWSKTQSHDDL